MSANAFLPVTTANPAIPEDLIQIRKSQDANRPNQGRPGLDLLNLIEDVVAVGSCIGSRVRTSRGGGRGVAVATTDPGTGSIAKW